jgi:hypothetical protein
MFGAEFCFRFSRMPAGAALAGMKGQVMFVDFYEFYFSMSIYQSIYRNKTNTCRPTLSICLHFIFHLANGRKAFAWRQGKEIR